MNQQSDLVLALEVGGSHVTAAVIDASDWSRAGAVVRRPLDPAASATTLTTAFATCALDALGTLAATTPLPWGVAMPGPFDYASGVGRFTGVAKFESLNGFDLRAALAATGSVRSEEIFFGNDADAFAVGEWRVGPLATTARLAALTLGTGIGSSFLADGQPVTSGPDVPPGGEAHLLRVAGQPLEDLASGRALRRAYGAAVGGDLMVDVREIAARARTGEAAARQVLADYGRVLGQALGPYLERFGAAGLVLGGSISGAWDLIGPTFDSELSRPLMTAVSADAEWSGLIGAASFARS